MKDNQKYDILRFSSFEKINIKKDNVEGILQTIKRIFLNGIENPDYMEDGYYVRKASDVLKCIPIVGQSQQESIKNKAEIEQEDQSEGWLTAYILKNNKICCTIGYRKIQKPVDNYISL
ncbi:MAG: hypothetical protein E7280_05235 [Lachnospiraceae bacterium]|nr:hypothetical protein [Lachnospiraceae bacterium]